MNHQEKGIEKLATAKSMNFKRPRNEKKTYLTIVYGI